MNDNLKVDVSFLDENPEEVIAILKEVGAQNVKRVEGRGFIGIEILIAGILVVDALANLVIRLLPLWKGGVIIDARGPRVLTKKDSNLARGDVVIISADGEESKLYAPSEIEIKSLIKSLI
jgi:hypothetical protein